MTSSQVLQLRDPSRPVPIIGPAVMCHESTAVQVGQCDRDGPVGPRIQVSSSELEDGMSQVVSIFFLSGPGSFRVIPGHAAVTVPDLCWDRLVTVRVTLHGPGQLTVTRVADAVRNGHLRPGPEPNRSSL